METVHISGKTSWMCLRTFQDGKPFHIWEVPPYGKSSHIWEDLPCMRLALSCCYSFIREDLPYVGRPAYVGRLSKSGSLTRYGKSSHTWEVIPCMGRLPMCGVGFTCNKHMSKLLWGTSGGLLGARLGAEHIPRRHYWHPNKYQPGRPRLTSIREALSFEF